MVYIKCFAPFCDSRHGKNIKCYFFLAPKNDIALNDWRRAIPRQDQTLSEKDYLCEKHFMPQDIIRFESVVVNGEVNNLPRKPILKEGAIPCIWPNCPSYLTKVNKNRKNPKNRDGQSQTVQNVPKQYKGHNSTSVAETISIDIEETTTTNNSTSVAETNSVDLEETVSYDNTSKTQLQALPIGWIELPSHQCDTGQHIYIKTVVDKDYAKCLPKMCKVDRLSRNIQFYAHSKPCFGPVVEKSFWEDFSLNIVLVISTFENMIRCPEVVQKWLRSSCKAQEAKNRKARTVLKDILLNGMMIEVDTQLQIPLEEGATINENIVYYIGGYMARKNSKKRFFCQSCALTLGDFENCSEMIAASEFTKNKNVGKLTFCKTNFYRLLCKVEKVFLTSYNNGSVLSVNAFHDILETIVSEELPPIGCVIHRKTVMCNLIYDYLLLRFKAVANAKTELWMEKKKQIPI